jgi:hypothetical protein
MNWIIIILVAVGAIALVVFLVNRNMKDEKEFESQLKNDYPKPKHDEQGDTPVEETVK